MKKCLKMLSKSKNYSLKNWNNWLNIQNTQLNKNNKSKGSNVKLLTQRIQRKIKKESIKNHLLKFCCQIILLLRLAWDKLFLYSGLKIFLAAIMLISIKHSINICTSKTHKAVSLNLLKNFIRQPWRNWYLPIKG